MGPLVHRLIERLDGDRLNAATTFIEAIRRTTGQPPRMPYYYRRAVELFELERHEREVLRRWLRERQW